MRSLADFTKDLRRLPRVVAHVVAEAAAPDLTKLAKATYDASETPYGVDWKPGAEGQKVTLKKSGALFGQIRYVPLGTKIRVALGMAYAKYQIGKRPVFPRQDGALPETYVEALKRAAVRAVKEHMR